MVEWLAFKAFMVKAWVWLKCYWYIPVLLIVGVGSWCVGRRNVDGILKMFEIAKTNYQKEIEVLNRTHEEELRKREELLIKYEDALKKVEEEYKLKLGQLTTAEKAEIKKIVKEHEDDPDGLTKSLSDTFGIEHVQ